MSLPVPQMFDSIVEANARQFGLDPDFLAAVIQQESRFDPNAVSHAGAAGLMQIMPETARQPGFGVPAISEQDRFDPEKSVQFGANFLRKMVEKYGDMGDALVAYNWGPGNADRWLANGGKFDDLPSETKQYIQRINRYYQQAKQRQGKAPEAAPASAQQRTAAIQAELQSPSRVSQMRALRAAQEDVPTGAARLKDEVEWVGKALAGGALDTVSLLAMLADGPFELTTPLVNKLDQVSQDLRESIPEWMKPSLHKQIFTRTEDGGLDFNLPTLRQVANLTLESLAPGGAIVGGGRMALRGLGKVRKLEGIISKHPKLTAAASLGAANSTYIAADTYREVYNRVLDSARSEGMSLKEAHDEASRSAALGATLAGAIAFPTGALGEGIAATGSSLWTRLAKGVTLGALTEAPEESGQYLAEQLGTGDPVDLAQFLERGVLGAFGAGPVEGILAAATGKNPDAPPAPVPPNEDIAAGLQEGHESVKRQTEELARNLYANQKAPTQQVEEQAAPEQPVATEPETAAPTQQPPLHRSLYVEKVAAAPVVATLKDGTTQHRLPISPLTPQTKQAPTLEQLLEEAPEEGVPVLEGVLNKDGTATDLTMQYRVFPREQRMQIMLTGDLKQKGQGKGLEIYENVVRDWVEKGYTVQSDTSVSQEASRVYEGLSRRGYAVRMDPEAVLVENEASDDGGTVWLAKGRPVFTVSAVPQGPREQGNLSLPPGSGPGQQLSLGQSELTTLQTPQQERKPTPVNRRGKFMKRPVGPPEPEVEPEQLREPDPSQQELPIKELEQDLQEKQATQTQRTKKGEQVPMVLEEPQQPIKRLFEQRKTATAHGKRTYGGMRLMDPKVHEYRTQKEAMEATKPIGSKVVRLGQNFYIAAPVNTGGTYEASAQERPADLSKAEAKLLDEIDARQQALDQRNVSRETLQETYDWATQQYRELGADSNPHLRYRIDALGNQTMERWQQAYEGETLSARRPVATVTPGSAAPPAAPVASPREVRSPPPAQAQATPSETGAQQTAAPAPSTPVSTPVTEPVPEAPPLDDTNSTAATQTPPSDEVARNPHTPPDMRGDTSPISDELEAEIQEHLRQLDDVASDPEDSPAAQVNESERKANRTRLKANQREFEGLLATLAKTTNVTWQALWYKVRRPSPTNAKAQRYLDTHPGLTQLPTKDLLKRIGRTYMTIIRMYLQDSFLPVRQVQELIREMGVNIHDGINFYQSHELMQSKIDTEWDRRKHNQWDPLAKRMRELGVTQRELDNYLWYTHAPYRNAYINQKRKELETTGMVDTIPGNPNPAGISDEEAKVKRRELIRGREEAFRELDQTIRELTQSLRDTYRNYGLVPDALLNEWDGSPDFNLAMDERMDPHRPEGMSEVQWNEEMFHATYVPLPQLMEGTNPYADMLKDLFGDSAKAPAVDVFGDEVRAAMGRTTPPQAITATVQMMTHMALIRGERNNTLLSLYQLAKENPNEYLWEVEENDTAYSVKRDTLTGLRTTIEETPRNMSETASMRANLNIEGIVAGDRGDTEGKGTFRMKKDGKVLTVHTYWAPLTTAILKSEKLPGTMAAMRAIGGFSRWIAVANTTLSPGFGVTNAIRDYTTAKLNLREKGLDVLNKHVNPKTWKNAMKAYWAELHYEPMPDETVDPEGYQWRKMAQRYRAAGAHTAFFQMRTMLDHYNEFERASRDAAKDGTPTKIGNMLRGVYNVMNAANTTVENAVRLATFAAAVDPNVGKLTDAQAASIAKNLTVNFQKRGHASVVLGALYVFFNATVQGNMRILGALRRSKHVRRAVYAMAAGGYVNALMNEILGGDDDDGRSYYSRVPEHVRERNIVFMIPGGQGRYVSIPLPYGFNAFWVTGDALASASFTPDPLAGPERHNMLTRPLAAFHNAFSPLASSSFWRAVTPTFGEPAFDIMMNTNYFGSPINPKKNPFDLTQVPDAFNVLDPDEQKVFQAIAQGLGKLTGGSPVTPGKIDVSPGTLRYLVEYLGGSGLAGATVTRVMDAVPMLLAGDTDKGLRKTPIIRRLYGMTPEFNHRERYYQTREFLAHLEDQKEYLRSIRKEEPDKYEAFMEENEIFWSTGLMRRMESTNRIVGNLTKRHNKLRGRANKTPAMRAMMDKYNQRIDQAITQFNTAYYNAIIERVGR